MANDRPNFERMKENIANEQIDKQQIQHDIPRSVPGKKMVLSAIELENSVAHYLECQCNVIKKLLCSDESDKIIPTLKSFTESLEQVCCIEMQLIDRLGKGLAASDCESHKG